MTLSKKIAAVVLTTGFSLLLVGLTINQIVQSGYASYADAMHFLYYAFGIPIVCIVIVCLVIELATVKIIGPLQTTRRVNPLSEKSKMYLNKLRGGLYLGLLASVGITKITGNPAYITLIFVFLIMAIEYIILVAVLKLIGKI